MNWDRLAGREPTGLTGRRGGTDEFLGRGATPRSRRVMLSDPVADPRISVWCSLGLTPTVERPRRSQQRSSQQQSGYNASEGEQSSAVRGAPVDFRGHIRVRPFFVFNSTPAPFFFAFSFRPAA